MIAWVVPNTQEIIRKHLDDDLEQVNGEKSPMAVDYAEHDKLSQSCLIPMGCNES
jgi:hypothetical protein